MSNLQLTIKLDASAVTEAVAALLEPGAVLLPAAAVEAMWDHHGVLVSEMIEAGGIAAAEQPKQES